MNYLSRFEVKKINLLFVQVLKIHPVYIIILQNEGCNKFDLNIIFGVSFMAVLGSCDRAS